MYVSIVMWDLDRSEATIASLRHYLRDYAVDAYSHIEGMRLKAWISDASRQLWGAVYFWDRQDQIPGIFPVSRAIELIGYPPTSVGGFDLEAISEGVSLYDSLVGLGLALESGDGGQRPDCAG